MERVKSEGETHADARDSSDTRRVPHAVHEESSKG